MLHKGYTATYTHTHSDGARHGEGLGDLLSEESGPAQGQRAQIQLASGGEQKHQAIGHARKTGIGQSNLQLREQTPGWAC
ncbi:MAG: hypothetical protein OXH72_10210 [Caldilineaceae bacterium]|nr:hypothetical protein [Caldilineaceae bacterium]